MAAKRRQSTKATPVSESIRVDSDADGQIQAFRETFASESPEAIRIIAAVRARGSDAESLRDAAHEAHHGLVTKAKRWDRESIHKALLRYTKRRPGSLVFEEIQARAVEGLVCERLGVVYNLEHWASICLMETGSGDLRIGLPSFEWLVDRIKEHRENPRVLASVEQILEFQL